MPIEYILLGVGIVLLGIEAVVPGFGFFGVTGLISLLAGSYYLLGGGAEAAYILLGVVLALGAVVALLCLFICPPKASGIPLFYGRNKRTATVIQVPRITRSILVNVERS